MLRPAILVQGETMKTAPSPGPFTRCGYMQMVGKWIVKVKYETEGIWHTVFIKDLRAFIGDRYAPPIPVTDKDGVKVGYAHRSLSGMALIISTSTSGGDLSCQWVMLQRVIHKDRNRVPVSRLNVGIRGN